jgi:hypothetical protein
MGSTVIWKVCTGLIVLLSLPSRSEEINPYVSVLQRNVFGLREPAPAAPQPAAPIATDVPELVLTGVVDFRLTKWALVTSADRGKQARHYTLRVGEKTDDLELLAIDAEAGTVRVLKGATEMVLTFEKVEEPGRKYVLQARPFVDAHTRAHELREQREQERRNLERVAAAAEVAAQQITTQQ